MSLQLASSSHGINNGKCTYPAGLFSRPIRSNDYIPINRQRWQIRMMLKGVQPRPVSGFGAQRGGDKGKHKLLTLDLTKAKEVVKYNLFARKLSKDEMASNWESIGEILLEKDADLIMAIKERRKRLLAAAQYQHPSLLMVSAGDEVQYGYREAGEDNDTKEINLANVKGELMSPVPALLRVDDGVKPPPKRY